MTVTAAVVAEIRDMFGYSLADSKFLADKFDGDIDQIINFLEGQPNPWQWGKMSGRGISTSCPNCGHCIKQEDF